MEYILFSATAAHLPSCEVGSPNKALLEERPVTTVVRFQSLAQPSTLRWATAVAVTVWSFCTRPGTSHSHLYDFWLFLGWTKEETLRTQQDPEWLEL